MFKLEKIKFKHTLICSLDLPAPKAYSMRLKSVPKSIKAMKNFSVSSGFHFSEGSLFMKLSDESLLLLALMTVISLPSAKALATV
jgi:hypothetical protein